MKGRHASPFMVPILLMTAVIITGCVDDGENDTRDYRGLMRDLVIAISEHAGSVNEDAVVITQNGNELLFSDAGLTERNSTYARHIDGVGQEDLFYGYDSDNERTKEEDSEYLLKMLRAARDGGLEVLVTDYCRDTGRMDDSYERNHAEGFISFAADHRELDDIPDHPDEPFNVNGDDITDLDDACNFLYLIDPSAYPDRTEYLDALRGTDHDILIIDAFHDGEMLTGEEVASLKVKSNGGSRLVISYLSIGEAEDYRYYWKEDWSGEPPSWLEKENPDWKGNYRVRYWEAEWQDIIFGSSDSYLDRILSSGFDGVYLDIIDAFEYYE